MAKALMGKASEQKGGVDFFLTIPGLLNTRDLDLELKNKPKSDVRVIRFRHQDIAAAFFRSMGFRRIGASVCFGLAKSSTHLARNISCTDDYDPAETSLDPDGGSDEENSDDIDFLTQEQTLKESKLRRMQKSRPLHHAVKILPDAQCVEVFEAHLIAKSNADLEWIKLDHLRNNILHVASCLSKPLASRWLMQHVDNDKKLRLARNFEGYTPLEALQAQLDSSRIKRNHGMMTICISDKFLGFPLPSIECLAALQECPDLSGDRLLRLKHGCTCGECLSGFMSPRMKFSLLTEAEEGYDTLYSDVPDEIWCDSNEIYPLNLQLPQLARNPVLALGTPKLDT